MTVPGLTRIPNIQSIVMINDKPILGGLILVGKHHILSSFSRSTISPILPASPFAHGHRGFL